MKQTTALTLDAEQPVAQSSTSRSQAASRAVRPASIVLPDRARTTTRV